MCFDTTISNTCKHSGACVLLEKKLQRKSLPLACRHHIMEIIIAATFTECLGKSSGPEVLIFKRFKNQWQFMRHENFGTAAECSRARDSIVDFKDHNSRFAKDHLNQQPKLRVEYREFCQLAIVFLGGSLKFLKLL